MPQKTDVNTCFPALLRDLRDCLFNRKVEDAALNSNQVNQLGLEGPHKVKLLAVNVVSFIYKCKAFHSVITSFSISYLVI